MHGGVNYDGRTLLSGGINVNTTGNIQALNVQVTENGERTITPPEGVDGYAPITIDTNVPIPEPVLDTLNVNSNGTYTPPSGVSGYNQVNVNVPGPVLNTLNVSSNGTYTPPSGVDGYDEITVNVSQDVDIQPLTRTITTNGKTVINASDLNVDGFDPVTITTAVDGYTIKTVANTPIPIATFSDGTSNPLKSLKVAIEPQQAGSGDPSPTNVRPISGHTEANVRVVGVNWGDCADIPEPLTVNKGYTVKLPYNTYTISFDAVNVVRTIMGNTYLFAISDGTTDTNILASSVYSVEDGSTYQSKGANVSGRFYFTYTGKFQSLVCFWRSNTYQGLSSGSLENIMIEIGNNPTKQFKPYNGQTYTIPFTDSQGQSVKVFGGSVDVINGVVTPCPYYASYNGEELTGEWISDRDVYSPNTSPTIGAQVVNIGATNTPFSVQPTSIKSLDRVNNVWASTGDVEELKYFADL